MFRVNLQMTSVMGMGMGRAMVSTTARLSELMCHQCEQVDRSGDEVGCSVIGVCGKTDEVAREQDLLIEQVKRIGAHAHAIKQAGGTVPDEVPQNMLRLMFSYDTPTHPHTHLHLHPLSPFPN